MTKLWRKGVMYSVASFLANLGHLAFQSIIGHQLGKGSAEYGYVNATLTFTGMLGLPLLIGGATVTHYVAHFNARKDDARYQGLLSGCRKFLLWLTLCASITAILLLKPLSDFFHLPRTSLMLVALITLLGQLWVAFGNSLGQGLDWYRRLAILGLVVAVLRFTFGWLVLPRYPVAETGVLATTVSLLAYLFLLLWRKELARSSEPISPYDWEFSKYLAVAAACVVGGWCFSQGDLLVAQRNFSDLNSGAEFAFYAAAGVLGRALPNAVVPALWVLFTSRSGDSSGTVLREQLRLLGLCAGGLVVGAACLLALRGLLVRLIFGAYTPESAALVGPFACTMVFVGLIQALGMWALASRWTRMALLYGASGLLYWLALFKWGHSPGQLLHIMPIAAAAGFVLMLAAWIITMRHAHLEASPR